MIPKITSEMREALRLRQGQPINVEDDGTQKLYVLIEDREFRQILSEETRRQIEAGLRQLDADDVIEVRGEEEHRAYIESIEARGQERLNQSDA